ncbi:beta-glucosidase [Algibacter pectinivorans]|uniref:Beta-glucosidase n=1 Tax=Algibacter pectinivorans TaxID=870482 RepID=A0A1I1QQI5_9FLAO|nr:glycoside hydrolase family 3 C-terminal domain-containing protein [Algibacter pectinivorans]SFD24371.1 beta-glucosidase [Algibacter pectinivorans]
MTFNKIIVTLLIALFTTLSRGQSSKNTDDPINLIINKLTVQEKVSLLHGFISDYIPDRFESGGIPRLNIPPIKMLDGPVGLRDFDDSQPTTALPSTLSLSCTWDSIAVRKYANVLANEMVSLDKQVLFGPGINLMRSPLGGRNFEYMGEDPFLTATLANIYIEELQKHNIAGCAKHIVANDIDGLRHFISSKLDERTLRELHLFPFEKVVKEANVWTIMAGNNLVNGVHVAENETILSTILRDNLKYDGVVVSDWRAAYTPLSSFKGGLDMSMGFCAYVYGNGDLLKLIKNGEIHEKDLNERVYRILRLYQRTGLLDKKKGKKIFKVNTPEHKKVALETATEGMVLLKNNSNLLPLEVNNVNKIIVTGPAVSHVAFGKGSSKVKSEFSSTPLAGLIRVYGKERLIEIKNIDDVSEQKIKEYSSLNYPVLYFAEGQQGSEGHDMDNITLPNSQSESINKWNKKFKTAVVVQSASAFETSSWESETDAVLCTWYAGQSTGNAIASVLSGQENPGGKLSFTMAKKLEDYGPHALETWPPHAVVDPAPRKASFIAEERFAIHGYDMDYKEGVLLGYRWFDTKGIKPAYEFGFGLSYSTFKISDIKIEVTNSNKSTPQINIKGLITNTSSVAGSEVVQVYVGALQSSVVRPTKELKAFNKIKLAPNETKTFSFNLTKEAFSFWDVQTHNWKIEEGKYIISVGTSSRQITNQEIISLD